MSTSERSRLFNGRESVADVIGERSLSPPILSTIEIQVDLLRRITESEAALAERIVFASAPLAEQIKLLVTISGITPLTAAAFLADIGDITRFKSLRQMNAYLGLVPRCYDSGGKSRPGHITRQARLRASTVTSSPSSRGSKPGSTGAEASGARDARQPSGARAATCDI